MPPSPAHALPFQVRILWFQLPRELPEGRDHPEPAPDTNPGLGAQPVPQGRLQGQLPQLGSLLPTAHPPPPGYHGTRGRRRAHSERGSRAGLAA